MNPARGHDQFRVQLWSGFYKTTWASYGQVRGCSHESFRQAPRPTRDAHLNRRARAGRAERSSRRRRSERRRVLPLAASNGGATHREPVAVRRRGRSVCCGGPGRQWDAACGVDRTRSRHRDRCNDNPPQERGCCCAMGKGTAQSTSRRAPRAVDHPASNRGQSGGEQRLTETMPARIVELWGGWEPDEREWLKDFRDALQTRYADAITRAVLFGSRARGDWNEDSDIDVLVIVRNEACSMKKEIRNSARACQWAEWRYRPSCIPSFRSIRSRRPPDTPAVP